MRPKHLRKKKCWELALRWRDLLSGELEMIADIIEIERAKRSIRQVAIARAGKVAEFPAVSMDGSSMARALRAVWRAMRRREVKAPATKSRQASG